jgi:membrane protein
MRGLPGSNREHETQNPEQESTVRALVFLKRLVKECQDDDIFGLGAEMAYWVVFSLFPFFIFLAALAGIAGRLLGSDDLLDNIMANLYSAVDYSTAETLRKPLNEVLSPNGGALSISAAVSALIALNTASGAMGTAMKACNRAYGVRETRNLAAQKGMALAFTVLLTVSLIGGTILLSVGGYLVRLMRLGGGASTALTWLRIGGGLVGIVLGFALLYWKSPNLRQPFRWVFPGVAVATLGLIALSSLFGTFVRLFAGENFNRTYGTLAGIVLFLFFVRLASIIVLVGAEINAEIAREQGVLDPMVREQHVEEVPETTGNRGDLSLRRRLRSRRASRPSR